MLDLYRIIPEPQQAEELPGDARIEWVVPVTGKAIMFSDDELEDMIKSLTATLEFMVTYPEDNDGYAEIQRLRERMRQQRAVIGDTK